MMILADSCVVRELQPLVQDKRSKQKKSYKYLYKGYISEIPAITVSFPLFLKLTPKNVKLTPLLPRNTGLCFILQYMAVTKSRV